jgi:Asp-tRNA(Asn)/Glu-tRNA(Gln) amidotransferase A subunit family amidase
MSSSMLFAPAVSVPLRSVGAMPVGVQLMGQHDGDARMTGFARWLQASMPPVMV